jgi:hypothetical protein
LKREGVGLTIKYSKRYVLKKMKIEGFMIEHHHTTRYVAFYLFLVGNLTSMFFGQSLAPTRVGALPPNSPFIE